MRFTCLLFVLFFTTAPAQKMQLVTQYHYKKLKSAQGSTVNGKKEGTWYYWNQLGQPERKADYHNDVLYGSYVEYIGLDNLGIVDFTKAGAYQQSLKTQKNTLFSTPILTHGNYKAGEKNGNWKYYNSDGVLLRDENYNNGKFDGEVMYYLSGPRQNTYIYHYKNGILHGLYQQISLQGLVEEEGEYENGEKTGEWKTVGPLGKKIQHFKAGKLHGSFRLYGPTDTLLNQSYYVDGMQDGPFMIYDEKNGERRTGSFFKTREQGIFRFYNKGRLYQMYNMWQGVKQGLYERYDTTSGIKREQGYYTAGLKDSIWTLVTDTSTCVTRYKLGELVEENCKNEKGIKTTSAYKNTNGYLVRNKWYANGRKKSEIVFAKTYELNSYWTEKGKLDKSLTIWYLLRNEPEEIPIEAGQPPVFPSGNDNLEIFISHNLWYPEMLREMQITGTVLVEFEVKADSTIGEIKFVKTIHEIANQEIKRVIKALPKWTPARLNGKVVNTKVRTAIEFKLDDFLHYAFIKEVPEKSKKHFWE